MHIASMESIAAKRALSPTLAKFIVSEMVKPSIKVSSEGYFSGGAGEAQFSSFLANECADRVAQKINLREMHG